MVSWLSKKKMLNKSIKPPNPIMKQRDLVDISVFSFYFKTFLECYGRKRLPNGIPFLRFEPESQIFQ